MTIESREKQRQAKLKNPTRYWLDKKRDDIAKEKMSISAIKRFSDPIERKKAGLGRKGKTAWNKNIPMANNSKEKLRNSVINNYKEHLEIKEKISDTVKKRWQNPKYRKSAKKLKRAKKAICGKTESQNYLITLILIKN